MTDAARLLTPREVAVMFRVGPKTVARWAVDGRLGCIRTLGGHRRFLEAEVTALLADETAPAPRRTGVNSSARAGLVGGSRTEAVY